MTWATRLVSLGLLAVVAARLVSLPPEAGRGERIAYVIGTGLCAVGTIVFW
jgi:hypothetical protein